MGVAQMIRVIVEILLASQHGFAVASDKGFLPSWQRGHNLKGGVTVNLLVTSCFVSDPTEPCMVTDCSEFEDRQGH